MLFVFERIVRGHDRQFPHGEADHVHQRQEGQERDHPADGGRVAVHTGAAAWSSSHQVCSATSFLSFGLSAGGGGAVRLLRGWGGGVSSSRAFQITHSFPRLSYRGSSTQPTIHCCSSATLERTALRHFERG